MSNLKLEMKMYLSILKNIIVTFKDTHKIKISLCIVIIHIIVGYFIYDYISHMHDNDNEFNYSLEMVNQMQLPNFDIALNKYDLVGNSMNVYVIDAGHGGTYKQKYYTKGKRSHRLSDGRIIYEGESNRDIANRLYLKCREMGYKCINLMNTYEDIKLSTRKSTIEELDNFCTKFGFGNVVCISIHSNASTLKNGERWSSPKGWSIYTSEQNNGSDILANIITTKMQENFPNETFRTSSGENKSRETDAFTMVKLKVPCVISENFFMTNKDDAKLLLSSSNRELIATSHFQAIDSIETNQIQIKY